MREMRLPKLVICSGLFLLLAVFLARPVDLSTSDIGRHIKNGEYLFRPSKILTTNFYSYTNPDYPVVNHHWGSGLVFYLLFSLFGFTGLSGAYLLLSLLAFGIFFRLAWKMSNFPLAVLAGILAIPLITDRHEVRPEVFSYFLAGLFLYALWRYQTGKAGFKTLVWLPLLEIIWVNLHIYFFWGIVLAAVFFLDSLIFHRSKAKALGILLFFAAAATLLNPAGLWGASYPLRIFENFGYRLVENQSVMFLENLHFQNPNFLFLKIDALLLAVVLALTFWKRTAVSWSLALVGLLSGTAAVMAIRNFAIFGYFLIPTVSYYLYQVFKKRYDQNAGKIKYWTWGITLSSLLLLLALNWPYLSQSAFGLGLLPDNLNSIKFFKENNLHGPIFNNYDIGGYLIYGLYPKERVFVDNRSEAYPAKFFEETYIPIQENETKWAEADRGYNFQTIFFAYHDLTPWGQQFLISRIADREWVPVYVDAYVLIFVRRNEANAAVIQKFAIPRERFGINRQS